MPARELLLIACGAFLAAWLGTALHGWPLPTVHDEFSYLLAGETLAAGRLANPAHALPQFFETFHVVQSPSYVSKYFPGHALFIALGLVIGDSARLGQWLAFIAAIVALAWCLRGWVARPIAWGVTGVATMAFAGTGWAHGYWASPVAVCGAALVLGAFGPLRGEPGPGRGVIAGAGAAILALTRPWEGFWVTIPPAMACLWWLAQSRATWRHRLLRTVVPGMLVLAGGFAFLALQSHAATGSWLVPPYVLYERSAAGAPPFAWQEAEPPARSLRITEQARLPFDLEPYLRLRESPVRALRERAVRVMEFFGGPLVAVLVAFVPFVPRRRPYVLPSASVLTGLGAISVSSFFMAHYVAPLMPALLVMAAAGLARVWTSARTLRFAAPAGLAVAAIGAVLRLSVPTPSERVSRDPAYWASRRDALIHRLESTGGRHLVFVHYDTTYAARHEWVQNHADREHARVLWAHDLGPSENERLLVTERGRQAWRIVIDSTVSPTRGPGQPERIHRGPVRPLALVPYTGVASPATPADARPLPAGDR